MKGKAFPGFRLQIFPIKSMMMKIGRIHSLAMVPWLPEVLRPPIREWLLAEAERPAALGGQKMGQVNRALTLLNQLGESRKTRRY